jgi:hypothetical protein
MYIYMDIFKYSIENIWTAQPKQIYHPLKMYIKMSLTRNLCGTIVWSVSKKNLFDIKIHSCVV